jgi:nucleotide-binding universal stress UspA family protein
MDAQHAGRAVVVGIDGSQSALKAVRWAAMEAARRNAPLRVVTAFCWNQGHVLGGVRLGADYRDIMLEEARRQLAEAVAVAEETVAGIAVEQELVVGYPIPVLREESRRAQVLVLGDRGHGALSELLVGSVAAAMAARAACPVVLVRADDDAPLDDSSRPVVVGVDGSPTSDAAVGFAFESASLRGVPLVAVHSWGDVLVDPAAAMLLDWAELEADEQRMLAEWLAPWIEKYPGVPVEPVVTRERPAAALVEQSRRAQLVVVGSRGRGAAAGLLLGSVSHAVLHKARCSVGVVRAGVDEGR